MNMELLDDLDATRERVVWGVLAGGTVFITAALARRAMRSAWRQAAGEDPPLNPASPDTSFREAVLWSVGTGVVLGLARLTARRLLASGWRRTSGELPPI